MDVIPQEEKEDLKKFRAWASEYYRLTTFLEDSIYSKFTFEQNFREVMKEERARVLLVQMFVKFGLDKRLMKVEYTENGTFSVTEPIFMSHHVLKTRPSKVTEMLSFVLKLLRLVRIDRNKYANILKLSQTLTDTSGHLHKILGEINANKHSK